MPDRRTLLTLATVILLVCGARAAEEPAAKEPVLQDVPLSQWIQDLDSDDYGKRERATEVLSAADASVAPWLKNYRDKAEDLEVRRRLAKVLAAVEVVAFESTFYQTANNATDGEGNAINVSNMNAQGTLEVRKGQLIWVQKYDGQTVTQSYSFPDDTPLTVKGSREIPLKFEKMESTDNAYNPDDVKPKLVVRNTAEGLQLCLSTMDVNQLTNNVVFGTEKVAPKEPPAPEPLQEEVEDDAGAND